MLDSLRRPRSSLRSASEEETVELQIDGRIVRLTLRRSRRARRISLSVPAATGVPLLTVPAAASIRHALEFASRQGTFLDRALARVGDRIPIDDGATIPLRGVPHRLRHAGIRGHVRIVGGDGEPQEILVPGDPRALPRRAAGWLKSEARVDLEREVCRHCETLGVAAGRIILRDPRTRWGSCSSRGELSFSWRLIFAPPSVLRYLAAHEVAHLREMNHGPAFWRLVKRLDPETDAAEAWLKVNGHTLHRYVVAGSGERSHG
ncbi:M48 family metallopeptidase [Lutibaculum baratangense]|uniref:Zinc metalloprotease n=1 Tax=Lutibaculum baratangense AMV1 TaxID=631454 RepID=V4RRF2_9HYPH|nr:SprT family zinc-dependent metalloprotease [Lutibaculum baratangense]ESR25720.1 Zinc metalloprotease [Lutibaculum baratangense AMV1]